MAAFLAALSVVLLAEMGDKTQLIVMAYAARYPWRTVLAGVFAGSLCNHLIAVFGGTFLSGFIPTEMVRVLASFAFIIFGVMTLRSLDEEEEESEHGDSRYGPFWTVAITFFLGEMGDKTQLAAFTVAAEFQSMWLVLLGTVTAMMLADGGAILLGSALQRYLPPKRIKIFAGVIFLIFGVGGLAGLYI